ncbi:MAG: DUF4838 domain-containing protein [Armatimonadota bacterium]
MNRHLEDMLRRTLWLTAGLVMLALCPSAQAAEPFFLTKNGKAQVDIIYQDTASDYPIPPAEQQQRFAESLADFTRVLKEISGAEVSVYRASEAKERPAANTIQIGPTPAAVQAGLVDKAARLKPHALLIHCDAQQQTLYLLGSTLEGSGHAMYQFLETLGCRWFYPGPEGEELPQMPSIALSGFDLAQEPAFEFRSIQLTTTSQFARKDAAARKEFFDWMRRNKFGGWAPPRGHSFPSIVGKQFAQHPEYYALRNGKWVETHLCMTNPATVDAAVKNLTELFTKNPGMRGVSVALADGTHYCECPQCTAACGGDPKEIMGLYLDFTRLVFDRVDQQFPGREFQYGTYVYANLMRPPTRPAPKQLAPYIAPLGYDPFHTFLDPAAYQTLSVFNDFPKDTRDLILTRPGNYLLDEVRAAIEGWGKGSSNMYLRDYDPYITFAQNLPTFRPYQLALEIPWYKKTGVRGFGPEAVGHSWFSSGINFWVRSRFYWDVKRDIKAEMTDMCKGMFGPAWEPMYGFFDALSRRTIETEEFRHGDEALTRLYSIEFVEGLDQYLRRAEALADTPKHQARVKMWRLCQQHMLKYLQVRNAELSGNYVEAGALCRDYLRYLDYIESVNPHYVDHRWYDNRTFSMQSMEKTYQQLADRQNGVAGTMLTALPLHWYFKHDPESVGVEQKWFDFAPVPEYENREDGKVDGAAPAMPDWQLMRTSIPWQTKEADYRGFNWYRTQAVIPESARGKSVRMVVAGIFGHMDFFINGKRLTWKGRYLDKNGAEAEGQIQHLDLNTPWSWNYNREFDVDVTNLLEPGKVNTFAFRSKDMLSRGGIFKSVFLYVPNTPVDTVYYTPHWCSDLNGLKTRARCDCKSGHNF